MEVGAHAAAACETAQLGIEASAVTQDSGWEWQNFLLLCSLVFILGLYVCRGLVNLLQKKDKKKTKKKKIPRGRKEAKKSPAVVVEEE
jgi:hypothetical protein